MARLSHIPTQANSLPWRDLGRLTFILDPDGHRIVVASYAGAPEHPSWFLNLQDRAANPDVLVRVQGQRQFWSRAEILEGEDYARIWEALLTRRKAQLRTLLVSSPVIKSSRAKASSTRPKALPIILRAM